MKISYLSILSSASKYLHELSGHIFDVITLSKPSSIDSAINLTKVISKLSPIIGNLIEFNTVMFLNSKSEFHKYGLWIRQDPGFPDALFKSDIIIPNPGIEIKAWFPFATEITARFKDSQKFFSDNQTNVCMLAWLPQHIFFGKPMIIDVGIFSGSSVAKARDDHYHNPPDYIVLEPENTSDRTSNLQQTNTNGYKFQGSSQQLIEAKEFVETWGEEGKRYSISDEYQSLLRQLLHRFNYRLDTNFAKMDRVCHSEIEGFKQRVMQIRFHDKTIYELFRILYNGSYDEKIKFFKKEFNIG